MVQKILKYEADCGGAQNTIDFKVLDSSRSEGSQEGEFGRESPFRSESPGKSRHRNGRQSPAKGASYSGQRKRMHERSSD